MRVAKIILLFLSFCVLAYSIFLDYDSGNIIAMILLIASLLIGSKKEKD